MLRLQPFAPSLLLLSFSLHGGEMGGSRMECTFVFVRPFSFNFLLPLASAMVDFPPPTATKTQKLSRREFCVTMSSRANQLLQNGAGRRNRKQTHKSQTAPHFSRLLGLTMKEEKKI